MSEWFSETVTWCHTWLLYLVYAVVLTVVTLIRETRKAMNND